MPENPQNQEPSESWWSVVAGAVLFLIFGLILISLEIPHNWDVPAWLSYFQWSFAIVIVLPAIGFGLGWIKDFPRWSFPYISLTFLMAWYLEHASTPGLRIFNYDVFGRELWGWRAWIPAIAATVIALLISRSLRPVFRLFGKVWGDWTLFAFGMFGLVPLLIAAGFDEMDRLFSLPFMVVLTLLMVGTAITYLRSSRHQLRVLALVVGIVLIVTISVITPTLYWSGMDWKEIQKALMRTIIIVLIMVSPWFIDFLRRLIDYLQSVKPDGAIHE